MPVASLKVSPFRLRIHVRLQFQLKVPIDGGPGIIFIINAQAEDPISNAERFGVLRVVHAMHTIKTKVWGQVQCTAVEKIYDNLKTHPIYMYSYALESM